MAVKEWMIISAFRYALGRATYVVDECAQWIIDNESELSEGVKKIMVSEIREALKRDQAGQDIDKQRWAEVLEVLK